MMQNSQPPTPPKAQTRQQTLQQIPQWLQKNLFNTTLNSLLTLLCLAFLVWVGYGFWSWLAQAQWTVITANLRLFFVGRYPVNQVWRLWAVLGVFVGMTALWTVPQFMQSVQSQRVQSQRVKKRIQLVFYALLPIAFCAIAYLANGGLGLKFVRTSLWGGLFLTLLTAAVSILLAFPFSILLALGRQSTLPIVRWVCTGYIELVRGLPLIGILFMAQVMLPLLLPDEIRLDRVVRAIAGLMLFNAAYLAENVRSGLQAIPKGQTEAAKALGLNTIQTLTLIILPQSLRISTPAIVGQFISLFKDTSLLGLFSMFELTGISRTILSQPDFSDRQTEVYLFIGFIYWMVCFSMSQVSRKLEKQKA
ncbi:amino acid ABC transporter permease [Alkalinema sp. FACHB-956]|uniref:amino acid ABC transporter permease n=1 Tax=Alkalinema sp. FACHB-956 TaxID=2692768 RepID=UPI0018EFA1D4|nr:amino acid ABC transporter permease [Alkalinema sp. FACHB-956]